MSRTTKFFRVITFLFLGLPAVLKTLPAFAWNNVGHKTIAELAWRQMTKDERRAASDLLRQHPHYKQILTAEVPRGVDKDEWAFLMAAVWPDLVRPAKHGQPAKPKSVTKYDLYPHAIGYPFLKRGETNRALLDHFFIARPDAEMVLSNSIITLQNKKNSPHDRAVALCWVLHLMGDLHQPLHGANMVSEQKPGGDGLGGFHMVRNGDHVISMHSLWDQLPGVDPAYHAAAELANDLFADPTLTPTKLPELRDDTTIASWVQESFRVATNFAYRDDLRYVHAEEIDAKNLPDSAIPQLPAGYVEEARTLAHRRLALAGYRLGTVIKQTW